MLISSVSTFTKKSLITPLKVAQSMGWVLLTALSLPFFRISRTPFDFFTKKIVEVWNKNTTETTKKVDKINPNTKSSLETLEEWVKAAPAGEDRIAAQKKIQEFLETSICKKIFYLFLSQSSILDLTSLLLTSLPNIFNDPCFNKLKILKLQNNQLETLPESFGNLQALQTLKLQNNQLETLPESFGNL
ncbi:MAG: leucine-rich repeat domain-containing protein, partial [Candidatus Rhabdochlamydia sp.]